MTAQLNENLILHGEKRFMNFCPPLPEHHPRLVELSSAEIVEENVNDLIFSTACWRRYVGTWAIMDGCLYLVGISGRYKIVGDEPIFADWFTGLLRFPEGKRLHYVHMGFGSVYEYEVHMEFDKGREISSRIVDNRGRDVDKDELAMRNLPGSENTFEGDDKTLT